MIYDHLSKEKRGLLALHNEMKTTTPLWNSVLEIIDCGLINYGFQIVHLQSKYMEGK